MSLTVTTPDKNPVSIAEIKSFLRIDHGYEDALIATWIRTATDICERFTGRLLILRDCTETLPVKTGWQGLSAIPVRAISRVEGLSVQGEATALSGSDYEVDIDARDQGWVRVHDARGARRVRIHYRAGLASDWNGIPESLRHGIMRLVGHFHQYRDAPADIAPPTAVTALWNGFRIIKLK